MATKTRQQPNVRGACEACHCRKVRCELSLEGGPCVNCLVGQRQCYYLPRARSGRPRASDVGARQQLHVAMDESGADSAASSSASVPASTTITQSTATSPTSTSSSRTNGNTVNQSSSSSSYNSSRSEWNDANLATMECDPLAEFLDNLGGDLELFSEDFSEMSGPHLGTSPSFFEPQPQDTLTPVVIHPEHPVTSSVHIGATSSNEIGSTKNCEDIFVMGSSKVAALAQADSTTFQSMLDLVTKLQSYSATLSQCLDLHKCGLVNPDISTNNSDLHTFLQAVEYTFTTVYAVFGPSAAAHHAIRSSVPARHVPHCADVTSGLTEVGLLSVTAFLKIFQGFELLSEYRIAPGSNHTADLFLLYARCAYNIVQTKVVLAQIGALLPSLRDIVQQTATRANKLELYFSTAAQESRRNAV